MGGYEGQKLDYVTVELVKFHKLAAKVREWAGRCATYEAIHRRDGNETAAEYHRGGKEAFRRCAEYLNQPGDVDVNREEFLRGLLPDCTTED